MGDEFISTRKVSIAYPSLGSGAAPLNSGKRKHSQQLPGVPSSAAILTGLKTDKAPRLPSRESQPLGVSVSQTIDWNTCFARDVVAKKGENVCLASLRTVI